MRIEESSLFDEFQVEDDGGSFEFVYGSNNIGFDVTQAKQLLTVLQHIVDTGELPE